MSELGESSDGRRPAAVAGRAGLGFSLTSAAAATGISDFTAENVVGTRSGTSGGWGFGWGSGESSWITVGFVVAMGVVRADTLFETSWFCKIRAGR